MAMSFIVGTLGNWTGVAGCTIWLCVLSPRGAMYGDFSPRHVPTDLEARQAAEKSCLGLTTEKGFY